MIFIIYDIVYYIMNKDIYISDVGKSTQLECLKQSVLSLMYRQLRSSGVSCLLSRHWPALTGLPTLIIQYNNRQNNFLQIIAVQRMIYYISVIVLRFVCYFLFWHEDV